MIKEKKQNLLGQLLLLIATLVWGTSFFILKDTIDVYPPMYVIGFRFLVSSILLFFICFKRVIKIKKGTFFRGVILGTCVALAYITQTYGLQTTSPATNAFLTSLYCVLAPFLVWLIYKSAPKLYNVISIGFCLLGLTLVAFSSNEGGQNEFIGCALTLIGAIFYSLQLVFIDRFQKNNDDTFCLLVVELFTVSIIVLALSFIVEIRVLGFSGMIFKKEHLFNIIYLTIACTVVAQLCQILGQKYTTANQAAIVLSLESVFGALFSVIFGKEQLTLILTLGFVSIFVSVLITELRVDFRKLFKKKQL
ncbi:MAG: DMT family transporter [Clostridia bacterium]|nr:DMT family transporter [Clostridia bacterium]